MTPPVIPDHLHGRPSGYREGCRCNQCRTAWHRKNKQWNATSYAHGGRTTIPAETLIPRLRKLNETMSLAAIGRAAGVSDGYVSRLMRGEIPTVGLTNATGLINAINNHDLGALGGGYVDVRPSSNRLRALTRLGYTQRALEDITGLTRNCLAPILYRKIPRIHSTTHATIRDAYDTHAMRIPAGATRGEKTGIARARRFAETNGWAPPFAWDDIEQPDAAPVGMGRDRSRHKDKTFDHAVVERLLAGETVPATPVEKQEAIRRWVAGGGTATSLAATHGWQNGRYNPKKAS